MPIRIRFIVAAALIMALAEPAAFARGGGGRGGGGGRTGGGGGASRPSGGGSYSRPSGGSNYSRPSTGGGNVSRPSQLPSGSGSRVSNGQLPAAGQRPSAGTQPSRGGGSAAQLPAANRPSTQPVRPSSGGAGAGNRPGTKPVTRPGQGDVGNFLGVAGGAAAGAAIGNAISHRPAERPVQRPSRPQDRSNWNEWSQNRNPNWQQRVDNRNQGWNNWQQKNQPNLDRFQNTRDVRWSKLQEAQRDGKNWRDQNREGWQQQRKDMWDYRFDRADEIRSKAHDRYDQLFDDRWWGGCYWGAGRGYWGFGSYAANPWWWWRPVVWGGLSTFLWATTPDPVYIDYGVTVIYEGETVYVDNEPQPAAEYMQPVIENGANVEQPPPPTPPQEGKPEEWMSLGVYAIVEEEKGEPAYFFQLSVNREGIVSGAYQNTISKDAKPVAGEIDKKSQRAAWRIGDNRQTIFTTSLASLTQDVSAVEIHFSDGRNLTWLLVRLPEPAAAGAPAEVPDINRTMPPVKTASAAAKP